MSTRTPGWLKRNSKIFKLLSLVNLDDDDMRAKLKELTGKTSRADLTEKDQARFLDWLQSLQGKDATDRKDAINRVSTNRVSTKKGRPRGPRRDDRHIMMATAGQKEEIKRTYFEILGWDEARVNGMIVRVSRGTCKSIDTLSVWAAANLIEAGKNLKRRDATNRVSTNRVSTERTARHG